MQPLVKRLNELRAQVDAALVRLRMPEKEAQVAEFEAQLATSEIWHNPTHAQDLSKQHAALNRLVDPWLTLKAQADDLLELMDLGDDTLLGEFDRGCIGTGTDVLEHLLVPDLRHGAFHRHIHGLQERVKAHQAKAD